MCKQTVCGSIFSPDEHRYSVILTMYYSRTVVLFGSCDRRREKVMNSNEFQRQWRHGERWKDWVTEGKTLHCNFMSSSKASGV